MTISSQSKSKQILYFKKTKQNKKEAANDPMAAFPGHKN
jgi:hypothetical protein